VLVDAIPNHTYKIECSEQVSIQNEAHLKPYWASPDVVGEAPIVGALEADNNARGTAI